MKTTTFRSAAIVAVMGLFLAVPSFAQPGAGMMGGGNGMGQGAGRGMHHGMRFNQGNTPGWSLMTPEERQAHQAKMLQAKTYDECKQLQSEHRSVMEERAKAKGITLPAARQNRCDNLKARGLLK